ncbi:MAG: hypothetical protein ACPGN3_12310 [Opitutales bacterium]
MNVISNILVALICASSTLFGGNYTIATTQNLTPKMAGEVYQLSAEILNVIEPGDTLQVVSASGMPSKKASIEKKEYGNDRMRESAVKPFFFQLGGFLQSAVTQSKNATITGHVDTPRLMRSLQKSKDEQILIIYGSTLWTGDDANSFLDDRYPEDPRKRLRRPSHGSITADKFLSIYSMQEEEKIDGLRVYWVNPMGDTQTDSDAYLREVENYWALTVESIGGKMASIQTDPAQVAAMIGTGAFDPLSPKVDPNEAAVAMLTVEDLTPNHVVVRRQALPAFTKLWLVDCSGSNSDALETIARRMTEYRNHQGEYFGLILFDTGNAALYSENANALEIAKAFRQVPRISGMDEEGSFAAGLKIAVSEILARGSKNVDIQIVSDVAPQSKAGVRPEDHYATLLQALLQENHKLTFVRCKKRVDTSWVPKGVDITSL